MLLTRGFDCSQMPLEGLDRAEDMVLWHVQPMDSAWIQTEWAPSSGDCILARNPGIGDKETLL